MSFKLQTRSSGAFDPSPPPVPAWLQHVAFTSNPFDLGVAGDKFKRPMPNDLGSANCIVAFISYPHGQTPTFRDILGNNWSGTLIDAVDDGAGNYVLAAYALSNTLPGANEITVDFGTANAIVPFAATFTEWMNVATVSPANGSSKAAGVQGPNLACGSFTPISNNDANGGNVVISHFATSRAATAGHNPTGWTKGAGHTLLDGNIAYGPAFDGFFTATQYVEQPVRGAINPGITAVGDTVDHFNCLAVALKAANAGTPRPSTGIYINRALYYSWWQATATMNLVLPSSGNCRVLVTDNYKGIVNLSGVADSESHGWAYAGNPAQADCPQLFYLEGASPNNDLTATVSNSSGTASISYVYLDLSGVAASALGAVSTPGAIDVTGATTVSNAPNLTPQAIGSLIVAAGGLGIGPGLGVTSPAGAKFILPTYAGEIDVSLEANADVLALFKTTEISSLAFNYNITPITPSNSFYPGAYEFKAA